jgi:hypothetical protein
VAVAVGHKHRSILAVLVEKARADLPKSFELKFGLAQRIGQRQHLEAAGHALHLGIQLEADAAHSLENALRGVLTVLLVVIENEAGREEDQWQRRSRDQHTKTHRERGLRHAVFPSLRFRKGSPNASIREALNFRQLIWTCKGRFQVEPAE